MDTSLSPFFLPNQSFSAPVTSRSFLSLSVLSQKLGSVVNLLRVQKGPPRTHGSGTVTRSSDRPSSDVHRTETVFVPPPRSSCLRPGKWLVWEVSTTVPTVQNTDGVRQTVKIIKINHTNVYIVQSKYKRIKDFCKISDEFLTESITFIWIKCGYRLVIS